MTDGPHRPALAAAVERCYAAMGRERVSSAFEVCTGDVCMTEKTRRAIVETPRRELGAELVREYTNSAHGVPSDTDDLLTLLPRYLELIAQGEATDYNEIGCELRRFGDAARTGALVLDGARREALDAWMRALLRHAGWLEGTGGRSGPPTSLAHLAPALVCGGWAPEAVTSVLDEVFADSTTGVVATGRFALEVDWDLGTRYIRSDVIACDLPRDRPAAALVVAAFPSWCGMEDSGDADRRVVAARLNGPRFEAAMEAVALSDELPEEQAAAGSPLHALVGRFAFRSAAEERGAGGA